MTHFPSSHDDATDDVDRLFARLEPAPVPADLTSRILARTVAVGRPSHIWRAVWPLALVGCLSFVGLVILGYSLGAELARTDGLDLLQAILDDFSLLATAPGDVAAALGETLPWPMVILALADTALLGWAVAESSTRLLAGARPRAVA